MDLSVGGCCAADSSSRPSLANTGSSANNDDDVWSVAADIFCLSSVEGSSASRRLNCRLNGEFPCCACKIITLVSLEFIKRILMMTDECTCSSLNPLKEVCRWNMTDEERESGSTLACGRAMANGFSSNLESAPPSPIADGSGGGVADGFRLCGSCRKKKILLGGMPRKYTVEPRRCRTSLCF